MADESVPDLTLGEPKLPPGWKNIPLGDCLTDESFAELNNMIRLHRELALILMPGENLHRAIVRRVCGPSEAKLEKAGVLPRFMAYFLEYKFFTPQRTQQ